MSTNTHQSIAQDIVNQFEDVDGFDHSVEEVAEMAAETAGEFNLQSSEIERMLENRFQRELGVDESELSPPQNETAALADLDEPETWFDAEVKIVDIWDVDHESIHQKGLLGDESGTKPFIIWEKDGVDLPTFEEGESVALESAVTSEGLNDSVEVKIVGGHTEVSRIDSEVEVGAPSFTGRVVSLRDGTGLIKRCSHGDCSRSLADGRCSEHGKVDGEFDLRIMGTLDNGSETQRFCINTEMVESLLGVTVEEAKQLKMENLNEPVIEEMVADALIGRKVSVEGGVRGDLMFVDELSDDSGVDAETLDALHEQATA